MRRHRRHRLALHADDAQPQGFCWIDANDADHSIFSWLRFDGAGGPPIAVLCNFTPLPREAVLIGLPQAGTWREVLNSDALEFGGSGRGNLGAVKALATPAFGQPASARVFLPPLCTIYLAPEAWAVPKPAAAAMADITTLGTKHA